jgi:hypothetical protein
MSFEGLKIWLRLLVLERVYIWSWLNAAKHAEHYKWCSFSRTWRTAQHAEQNSISDVIFAKHEELHNMIPRKINHTWHKRTSGETVLDRARFREESSVSSLSDSNLPAATATGNLEICLCSGRFLKAASPCCCKTPSSFIKSMQHVLIQPAIHYPKMSGSLAMM